MTRDINDVLQNWLWKRLLGDTNCATYDGAVDLDVLNIIEAIACAENSVYYTTIAERLFLNPNFVQLVQFMICGAGYADYGSSPRGCWMTPKGLRFYRRLRPYHQWLRS